MLRPSWPPHWVQSPAAAVRSESASANADQTVTAGRNALATEKSSYRGGRESRRARHGRYTPAQGRGTGEMGGVLGRLSAPAPSASTTPRAASIPPPASWALWPPWTAPTTTVSAWPGVGRRPCISGTPPRAVAWPSSPNTRTPSPRCASPQTVPPCCPPALTGTGACGGYRSRRRYFPPRGGVLGFVRKRVARGLISCFRGRP